jgi:acetolactate decarboxylase
MKLYPPVTSFIITITLLSGCAATMFDRETVFQQSTIDALLRANYQSDLNFSTLKEYGDFGIGTFNDLDGEMLALDGTFYQIKSDSKVYPVSGDMSTPFASVTFFDADIEQAIAAIPNLDDLNKQIDTLLPTDNIFYAIKISGTFDHIKVRSIPKQQKPYQPLVEVVKAQSVYEFNQVEGTLVGFKCPVYMNGINVPGYHFHFINRDKTQGGHVLACAVKAAQLEIDSTNNFAMRLPEDQRFYTTDLQQDQSKDLGIVEK